ncbi:LysR family transcriptional regulator [Streptomyces sp. NBC_01198]|uniref:LysR family transcriptional regulator n=1 Tax=Streptomyces sp. NBC_01198 TaxID=2903769 RepID=UPI002E13DD0F|nr:LysR family transcriptional regulator [Streptomyces sp. NBC_01198]
MVTLRALECLVALSDEGTMTRAAAVLHMSQPALSHQIASVEKELGTPVAERMKRGVVFTAAGRATVEEARKALAAADRAVRVGKKVGDGLGGKLRIACAETMTPWLLIPILRQWHRRWPDVELDLQEFTSSDRMVEHLMENGTDLVVGPEPTSTTAHVQVLGQEEVVIVASADHRFAACESVTVPELATEAFVHYHTDNGMAIWVDQFAAAHRTPLRVALRTFSPRTAAQMAGAGLGVTIVPVSALVGRFPAEVRRIEPRVHRDIVALTMTPSDVLVHRFITHLKRRGLPNVDTSARLDR